MNANHFFIKSESQKNPTASTLSQDNKRRKTNLTLGLIVTEETGLEKALKQNGSQI